MTNRLRIRAKSLNLDLVGEAEYIMRAYDAIHPVLVERFEESIEGVLEQTDGAPPSDPLAQTIPMHRAVDPTKLRSGELPQHINVVICNEVYNKIYLVDRNDIRTTAFRRIVDFDAVHRIYVNRAQREQFRGLFELGKVLWRELTSAGKAVVKGT